MKNKIGILIVFSFVLLSTTSLQAQEVDYTLEIVSSDWNSLEIVKLITSLLMPAAMLFVGIWLDRRIKEFEHRQWFNQKVIEKRLAVYEELTPKLNDIMCYFLQIGTWKERNPNEIIDMKREIDKIAYVYAPLFSPKFLSRYNEFMGLCYAMFRGAGKDAQLRTEAHIYREAYVCDDDPNATWNDEWDDCFTGSEEAITKKEVTEGYRMITNQIATEIGVEMDEEES